MSKKSKRQARKSSTPAAPVITTPSSRPYEFNPDYSYVIKDLRRIGTLAGTFIAILIILSFFLR